MGKPYLYTRIFKPLGTYDYRFWVKLENSLNRYTKYVSENPIEETKFSEAHWHFPFDSKLRKDLYNIIIYIAKITGTKIMWKYGISWITDNPEKHLLIVGENTRVIICFHILNYTIGGIMRFEDYLKKNERVLAKALCYKTITSYVSEKVNIRVSNLERLMESLLNEDQVKINRLENYIMGRYKLDYKYYGQVQNAYYNAISKEFHPKRLML